MKDIINLDNNYSTTKLLTKEKPVIKNNPEDKFESFLFLSEGENRLRTQGYFKKSYNKPLISIITVIYNGEEFLEEIIH